MYIHNIIMSSKRTISFEVFPPRDDSENREQVDQKILAIAEAAWKKYGSNTYISVTHRAGTSFDNTLRTCAMIKSHFKCLPVVAHMTTIGLTREELDRRLVKADFIGIDAILALRGDYPEGYDPSTSDFKTSTELIQYIRDNSNIEVGGSWYPENYPGDTAYQTGFTLEKKWESGASFLIGQMSFDLDEYEASCYRLRAFSKVDQDILVPGVLPITTRKAFDRNKQCNVKYPSTMWRAYNLETNYSLFGEKYFQYLVDSFYFNNHSHVHIYTMNRPEIVYDLIDHLGDFV